MEVFKSIEGVSSETIKHLYVAKCTDLQLPAHQEPMKRFFDYCSKSIKDRSIKMNEQGLGPASATVIANIFKAKAG